MEGNERVTARVVCRGWCSQRTQLLYHIMGHRRKRMRVLGVIFAELPPMVPESRKKSEGRRRFIGIFVCFWGRDAI